MTLPDSIKIGGYDYKVCFPYTFRERVDLDGQCDSGLFEIRVCDHDPAGNKKPDAAIVCVLLHEILHAVAFVSGGKYSDDGDDERTEGKNGNYIL